MDNGGNDDPVDAKTLEQLLTGDKLPEGLGDADRREIANYLASMLVEMRKMALAHELSFLVYLIEMAFQEAYKQAQADDRKAA
ncbi:MAG: hypothetical protein AAF441_29620 [Pseudomonadota bacterium]